MLGRLRIRVPDRDDDRGAVVILFAIFLIVFMVLLAFVVDLGQVYARKAELQSAVDAAALAGAGGLCGVDADPAQTAVNYAGTNGVTIPKDVQHVVVDTTANTVSVRAEKTQPSIFGGFAGVSSVDYAAFAKAAKVCGIKKFGLYADRNLTFNGTGSTSATIYGGDGITANGGSTALFAETDPTGSIDSRLAAGTKSKAGQGLTAAQYAYLVPAVGTTKLDAATDVKFDTTSGVSYVDQMSNPTGARSSACGQNNRDTGTALNAGISSTRFVCSGGSNNTVNTSQLNSGFASSVMAVGSIGLQGGGSGCINITSALIYSLGDITFQGVCLLNANTIVYAPNGTVTFNGSSNSVAATVIARDITFNGAKQSATNEGTLLSGTGGALSLVE